MRSGVRRRRSQGRSIRRAARGLGAARAGAIAICRHRPEALANATLTTPMLLGDRHCAVYVYPCGPPAHSILAVGTAASRGKKNRRPKTLVSPAGVWMRLKREAYGCSAMKIGANTSVIVLSSLITMCSDGPAVSLNGSPTVSPTTPASWAGDRLPSTLPFSSFR